MAQLHLDFINSFYDSRGKLRHQFRRKGHRRVTIKGKVGSPEFMLRYQELLEQTSDVVTQAGASRTKPGTIDALVVKYLKHECFTKGLSKASRDMRRPLIDRFRNHLTPIGRRRYGENHFRTMTRTQVENVLEGKSYAAQINMLKALRHLFAFAISEKEMAVDPSIDIKPIKPGGKSTGYMTWKPPQVEQYRAAHPVGTMARLALELMLNIAARRTDTYQIGRPHMTFNPEINANVLTWRPQKTANSSGKVLSIPVLPFLQEALDAVPKGTALTFLVNDYGRPFASAAAFGNKFADWCVAAGLKPVLCADGRTRNFRAHGLRKAALYTLYKLGATNAQLQSIGGHSSLAELQKYIQEVEQDEQAIAAMALVAAAQKAQMQNRR